MQKDFDIQLLQDFLANPSYETKLLSEVCQIIKAKPDMNKEQFAPTGIPYLHYGQIHSKFNSFTEQAITFADPEQCSKATWVHPGDVIITAVSEDFAGIAKPLAWLGNEPAVVSGGAMVLKSTELNPLFLTFYLQHYKFRDDLRKVINSSTLINLRSSQLGKIKVKIPPLKIQKLIGNFLSVGVANAASLDAEIELRKFQFFAYSQKLLSLYPDGHLHIHNNPLLSVKKLPSVPLVAISTIAKVQRGNPRNTEEYIKKHSGIYPVYTGSINGASGFIDSFEYDGEYVTYINTSAGAGLVYYRNEKFNLNLAQTILIPLQPNIYDTKYLTYALRLVAKKYINPAGGMQKLNPESFGRIKVPLPPLEIQKEIGDFLYKIEQLIENKEFGLQKENQLRKTQLEYLINKLF